MADLITVQDITERLGHTLPGGLQTQAARFITDATALVRLEAGGLLDDVDPPDVPPAIVTVMWTAVRRAMANPLARSSEAIDGHQWSESGATGVYLTEDEKTTIRRQVGLLGAVTVGLQGYLPIYDRHLDEVDVLGQIEQE